mmetsp:Transcript_36456/g.86579  ORF Transcript_36456/g.86579 Transcript_36456/m.86579 type:complete len:261 (+) Transcript_36456:435-1217(+)
MPAGRLVDCGCSKPDVIPMPPALASLPSSASWGPLLQSIAPLSCCCDPASPLDLSSAENSWVQAFCRPLAAGENESGILFLTDGTGVGFKLSCWHASAAPALAMDSTDTTWFRHSCRDDWSVMSSMTAPCPLPGWPAWRVPLPTSAWGPLALWSEDACVWLAGPHRMSSCGEPSIVAAAASCCTLTPAVPLTAASAGGPCTALCLPGERAGAEHEWGPSASETIGMAPSSPKGSAPGSSWGLFLGGGVSSRIAADVWGTT